MTYLIEVPKKYQENYMPISAWLWETFDLDCFKRLFYHEFHGDSNSYNNAKCILGYVEFKNEEDAVAFKLQWYGE